MRHLDLFSGIGGFALAADWVWGKEHEIVSFVEIDPFCQKVLKKHWPDVPIVSDIRSFNGAKKIDLITGGFPCQPFSVAGKQRSAEDDRYLWPQMFKIIRAVQPTWIIGENVAGIINLALDQVLSDLEDSAYEVQPFLIPACGVDAPHRRDRVWIVAHNSRIQRGWEKQRAKRERTGKGGKSIDVGITKHPGLEGFRITGKYGIWWPSGVGRWQREPAEIIQNIRRGRGQEAWLPELESKLGRVAHGVPGRVDRLKSLGNAIVPQVVVPIMQAIKEIEST